MRSALSSMLSWNWDERERYGMIETRAEWNKDGKEEKKNTTEPLDRSNSPSLERLNESVIFWTITLYSLFRAMDSISRNYSQKYFSNLLQLSTEMYLIWRCRAIRRFGFTHRPNTHTHRWFRFTSGRRRHILKLWVLCNFNQKWFECMVLFEISAMSVAVEWVWLGNGWFESSLI